MKGSLQDFAEQPVKNGLDPVQEVSVNLADSLRRQFVYDAWANQEVLKAINGSVPAGERALELMSHILAAERLWWERLKQKPQAVQVWPKPNFEQCAAEAAALPGLWDEYLEGVDQSALDRSIAYKNSKGETWTSSVLDILQHVIMHSAYHRGQIASHMRMHGQTPAYSDYIHAVRQGFVK